MSVFSPVRKLTVFRCLSSGERVPVGVLAQNTQAVFFQYSADYLQRYSNLSPFTLTFDNSLQQAPKTPHAGLHGVFADSLPDGWGLLLMDRVFRQQGILPQQLTGMDRLAYVGNRGIGALDYEPVSGYLPTADESLIDIAELGMQAQALFDGQTTDVLAQLANAGSSGGARPKAQVYLRPGDLKNASTQPQSGLEPWLVKFTTASVALGHEESLCEAAYLVLAARAGIDVPEWQLIPAPQASGAKHWLALKRFDCSPDGGRYHLHSLCGLLDADFRMPSMDYEDLIKASSLLCKSPAAGQAQFRRAVFNLLALNQDDHTKNWAFLQDDRGNWRPAPFYDVTFSPSPHGEHSTSFAGFGKAPPLKAMQRLARQANFADWQEAQQVIQDVVDAISHWRETAADLGVSKATRQLIGKQLDSTYRQNQGLLGK
ncbi:MAG: type II toxin-antitoxin system HipA family toxin [Candidatus Competibacteraceae bacterium]|nr:type II toxin-antitoxin system HipA family toxin [Candidatus Competibacteraceae bacterium]